MPASTPTTRSTEPNPHFSVRTACPACGAAGADSIFSRPYAEPNLRHALERSYEEVGHLDYTWLAGVDYTLQRCPRCRLVFQRNVPGDFLLGKLYEEWIDPEKAFQRSHARVPLGRRMEIARDVFTGLSLAGDRGESLRALDYGCGWGEWALMTRGFGAEPWGTELSPSRRTFCEQHGVKIVDEAALPDGHFHFINADQVFEHLPHPRTTLALLARKLAPAGVIRLAVPNGLLVRRALGRFDRELERPALGGLNPVAPLEHLNCFTTPGLLVLGFSCNLRRVLPPWRVLWSASNAPRGLKAKVKSLARPFYLRSRWVTQLYFRRVES